MSEDFPQPIKANRKKLYPLFMAAKRCEEFSQVSLKLDVLFINGTRYTVDNLQDLPESLKLNTKATITTNDVTVFASKDSILSNLHEMDVMIDGRIYNTNEQFIQFSKANLFKDPVTAQKILDEPDPYKQMSLGKEVKGYTKTIWEANVPRILNRVNREKYAQNAEAREFLIATGTRTLGEATKHPLFGIGKNRNDPDVTVSNNWQGQNLMGHTLQEIRNHLKPS